ncbi:hypothetical protein AALP_AA2G067600 [Arabis alpina]|uniref:Uncharacterized protein n=1 Tax=Arabis alpina TaxID=50452 RepID=A0A087HFR5_ARAAL|nr:hypothetical protein AALP_AA2G067600 [Arabis alpina]
MAMGSNNSVFFKTDCSSIVSQINDQEEQLRLKRRWLLGCELSESEIRKADFLKSDHFLPESVLREDDIFNETVKSRVEKAFGFRENEQVRNNVQQNDSKMCTSDVIRELGMNLDSLTSNALYLIAMIITGGSTSFDKTPKKMKETIRESINKDFKKKKEEHDMGKADIVNQLHQVLSVPGNFRKDCMIDLNTPTYQSHRDAAMTVLNELDKLSTQTLLAMKRKLKGSRMTPRLKTSRCGQSRSYLINQVKQASEKMLSQLSPRDKLPEKLAKAMSLEDLSRMITPAYIPNPATEFFQFSPETKKLQNEIVKALWLLPKASDMECIPSSLTKALSLVNRSSRNVEHKLDHDFTDAYMEEPEDRDDDDYENCVLSEVKDTDEEDSYDSDDEESVAECSVLDPTTSIVKRDMPESISRRVGPRSLYISDGHDDTATSKMRGTDERDIEMEVDNQKTDDHGEQKQRIRNKNQYLAVQEMADETSLVAHNLIGRLLEKFADRKGLDLEADERSYLGGESRLQEDVQGEVRKGKQASSKEKSDGSITVSVVKELMPSLEKSVLTKLQELMDLS